MVKIIEIKQTLEDSSLIDNIYKINRLTSKIIRTLQMTDGLNIDDFNYMNVVAERSKIALEKVYRLI